MVIKLQGFRRAWIYFDQMMEDLGVRGDERVKLVTSNIDGRGVQGGLVCRSIEMVLIFR